MTYPISIIDAKKKINLVDLANSYGVKWQKYSANHHEKWAICPFHAENTPSFSINTQKQLFKCLGCGAQGDAVTFLQLTETLSQKDAIAKLIELAIGGSLPPAPPPNPAQTAADRRKKLKADQERAKTCWRTAKPIRPGDPLGIAWVILREADQPTPQERDAWTEWLTATKEETPTDADACLLRLITYRVPDWDHGIRPTVAELINWVMQPNLDFERRAREALARIGCQLYPVERPAALAIANRGAGIDDVFKGTKWANGVHSQTLRRLDGADAHKTSLRIAGSIVRVTMIPVGAVWSPDPAYQGAR